MDVPTFPRGCPDFPRLSAVPTFRDFPCRAAIDDNKRMNLGVRPEQKARFASGVSFMQPERGWGTHENRAAGGDRLRKKWIQVWEWYLLQHGLGGVGPYVATNRDAANLEVHATSAASGFGCSLGWWSCPTSKGQTPEAAASGRTGTSACLYHCGPGDGATPFAWRGGCFPRQNFTEQTVTASVLTGAARL